MKRLLVVLLIVCIALTLIIPGAVLAQEPEGEIPEIEEPGEETPKVEEPEEPEKEEEPEEKPPKWAGPYSIDTLIQYKGPRRTPLFPFLTLKVVVKSPKKVEDLIKLLEPLGLEWEQDIEKNLSLWEAEIEGDVVRRALNLLDLINKVRELEGIEDAFPVFDFLEKGLSYCPGEFKAKFKSPSAGVTVEDINSFYAKFELTPKETLPEEETGELLILFSVTEKSPQNVFATAVSFAEEKTMVLFAYPIFKKIEKPLVVDISLSKNGVTAREQFDYIVVITRLKDVEVREGELAAGSGYVQALQPEGLMDLAFEIHKAEIGEWTPLDKNREQLRAEYTMSISMPGEWEIPHLVVEYIVKDWKDEEEIRTLESEEKAVIKVGSVLPPSRDVNPLKTSPLHFPLLGKLIPFLSLLGGGILFLLIIGMVTVNYVRRKRVSIGEKGELGFSERASQLWSEFLKEVEIEEDKTRVLASAFSAWLKRVLEWKYSLEEGELGLLDPQGVKEFLREKEAPEEIISQAFDLLKEAKAVSYQRAYPVKEYQEKISTAVKHFIEVMRE